MSAAARARRASADARRLERRLSALIREAEAIRADAERRIDSTENGARSYWLGRRDVACTIISTAARTPS